MLHTVYLTGLCQRRQWPEPFYQVTPTRHGYTCVVRVNNREYQTSRYHSSEITAKEGAALIAFTICRSFSVNDGMFPNGFAHDNIVQGRAVPVGAPGRTSRQPPGLNAAPDYRHRADSSSTDSRSGGSSPELSDGSENSNSRYSDQQPITYAALRQETYPNRGPIRVRNSQRY